MQSIHLYPRGHPSTSPIYIAGFCAIGLVILGLVIWLGVRQCRKRLQVKREDERVGAFLSVRGLVTEVEGERVPSSTDTNGSAFSRDQMSSSAVLPNRAKISPQTPTADDILQHHQESGTFPRPFSFALSASASLTIRNHGPVISEHRRSPFARPSTFLSTNTSASRFSVMSASSTSSSVQSSTGHPRKVRQLFDPVLPDELLISHVGERLTVVQSFDDGWCVVGRESSPIIKAAVAAKSLFRSGAGAAAAEPDVELGVVPAWCFLKPVKGLRAERPVRGTSLGITVQLEGSGFSSRHEVPSWSNF